MSKLNNVRKYPVHSFSWKMNKIKEAIKANMMRSAETATHIKSLEKDLKDAKRSNLPEREIKILVQQIESIKAGDHKHSVKSLDKKLEELMSHLFEVRNAEKVYKSKVNNRLSPELVESMAKIDVHLESMDPLESIHDVMLGIDNKARII